MISLFSLSLLACVTLSAMGEESFGNEPVVKQPQWASGVLEVVNAEARVYRRWVNGNEDFCFRGGMKELNVQLLAFSRVMDPKKEVVLLPGVGRTVSFEKIEVPYDWLVHVPSGIYLAMAMREKGSQVLRRNPSLTIHCGAKGFDLSQLVIPDGLTVIGSEDVVARAKAGLESDDPSIRGQALMLLGRHPDVPAAIVAVTAALESKDSALQVSALAACATMGGWMKALAPKLKALRSADDERVRYWAREADEAVRDAKVPEPAKPALATLRSWIQRREDARRPQK